MIFLVIVNVQIPQWGPEIPWASLTFPQGLSLHLSFHFPALNGSFLGNLFYKGDIGGLPPERENKKHNKKPQEKNTSSPEILQSGADSTCLFSRTGGVSDPLVFSNMRPCRSLSLTVKPPVFLLKRIKRGLKLLTMVQASQSQISISSFCSALLSVKPRLPVSAPFPLCQKGGRVNLIHRLLLPRHPLPSEVGSRGYRAFISYKKGKSHHLHK